MSVQASFNKIINAFGRMTGSGGGGSGGYSTVDSVHDQAAANAQNQAMANANQNNTTNAALVNELVSAQAVAAENKAFDSTMQASRAKEGIEQGMKQRETILNERKSIDPQKMEQYKQDMNYLWGIT